MNFGEVIEAMKKDPSKHFARKGWNGKGYFIYFTPGHTVKAEDWTAPEECVRNGSVTVLGHIDCRQGDGTVVIGWNPWLPDLLAEDWEEVI